jgi:hypothetical protein
MPIWWMGHKAMKQPNSSLAANQFQCEHRMQISRRNWLGIGIWMSIQPKTYAAKPPLVLALDQTSFWYLGNAASQLITADSLQTTRTIASLNDDDVAIVVMDLACRSSQALLNEVTQRVKARHAKVYGVGLAPFKFEGPTRHSDGRHGWLQLHEQTDGYKVVRSEEAAERLGEDVTWEEAQGYLMEAIKDFVNYFKTRYLE